MSQNQFPLASLRENVIYGSQPVLAHANHSHSTSSDPEAVELEDEADGDVTETLESQSNPAESTTAIEETPNSAEISAPTASTAKLADGFSFGFGESIFGLMIAAPFLLLSLKKMCR